MNHYRQLKTIEKVLGERSLCRTCKGDGGGPYGLVWLKARLQGLREAGAPARQVRHPRRRVAMSLARRVRAVEAKFGAAAVCPACKGEGSKAAVMVWMPDEQPKPERPQCHLCGEPARNVTMVIIERADDKPAAAPPDAVG